MTPTVVIAPFDVSHMPELETLLERAGLPVEGLDPSPETTLVALRETRLVGSATVRPYGAAGLLRSVVVSDDVRGSGVGKQLTVSAIDLARAHGLSTLYLLTETAEGFFPRFGFTLASRTDVPATVAADVEFSTLCPASARVMTLDLAARD